MDPVGVGDPAAVFDPAPAVVSSDGSTLIVTWEGWMGKPVVAVLIGLVADGAPGAEAEEKKMD